MEILRKYATATHVYIPVIKRGVVDFAVSADWTPATGDVKVSIDGAAAANIGTLPTAVAMGNTAYWDFTIASGETTGKKIIVTVADSATKAVEDQAFDIITFGHASAEIVQDISASIAQTGDSYARIGAAGVSLSAIPDEAGVTTLLARLTAARGIKLDAITLRDGTAQAGAAGSITLDAGASATDNLYRDLWVEILSGTGLGQARLITGYTGATKVALIAPNWITNPDNTSVFSLLPISKLSAVALVDVLTTYTGNTVQTGDSFARIGANGVSLSAIPDLAGVTTLLSRLSAARAGYLDSLNGNVAQTGDSYARIGAGGVSLNAIPDEAGVTTLLARLTAARAGYLDTLNTGVLTSAASNTAIRDAILAYAFSAKYGSLTLAEIFKVIVSVAAGVSAGATTVLATVKTPDGSATVFTADVDASGNVTAIHFGAIPA